MRRSRVTLTGCTPRPDKDVTWGCAKTQEDLSLQPYSWAGSEIPRPGADFSRPTREADALSASGVSSR